MKDESIAVLCVLTIAILVVVGIAAVAFNHILQR